MANKKNVEANKKNTETKNKKSNELEQQKPTKKKKLRLHSHLKVNIPLFQSLMMILPSLAKHAAAETIDNSSGASDQVIANNVTEKDVTNDHTKADSSSVALQEAQTSDSDVNSILSASHAPNGSSSHLVPSHHLSTLSHPQVHYIPSVSMPTISSGSNSQPTHSNAPTMPALPVTFMPEVIKGTYGELHVDANGQYTFVLNPNSPQYILLNQHQPGTDHFALHLSNGSSIIVQIPVIGKQDTPSISGDLTGVVTEDHNIDSQGLLHANGKIDVTDPDQNESSVTPEVISGKYGALTIDADGHWQYQVDNSLSNVQALTAATSLHESFTIHTKDGTPQTIDMTIGGNDDNAVITGVDAGTVTEDLTTQVQGQLSVTDSDLGEDHFQASQVTSNFGTLSITKDGAWTYDLDNNNPVVQGLGQGSTATDIVTVHSADGTAHQVTVTINGTNDHAVITSSTANSPSSFFAIGRSNGSSQVTEDKDLTVSGQLNITDIDSKEAHFSNSDLKGTLGTLHLKDNGDWTYDLDNKNPQVQALGKGSATTDIITIHSADGTPHQITITVNGTNDKAVISGTSTGLVTEESQLQTSGTLTVTDVDTGEVHFSNTDIAGSLGTLHLTDSGSWTYDLDNANPQVQALGQGATATETITVQSVDGTTHQVTITVNGTNDIPVIKPVATQTVTEDGSKTITFHATDVDTTDTLTPSVSATHGTAALNTQGEIVFTPDANYNGPATVVLSVTDGHTTTSQTINVDVTPANDAPVITPIPPISATEDGSIVTGKIASTDIDTGDTASFKTTFTQGGFTLNTDGSYKLDPTDASFQHLKAGEIETLTIPVTVTDSTGATDTKDLVITITGTNDAPTISGIDTGTLKEDVGANPQSHNLTATGKLDITDVDTGESSFVAHGFNKTGLQGHYGHYGHLQVSPDGSWSYFADNSQSAIQTLGKNEHLTDTITVTSKDGTTHDIIITINGTNDAPVIKPVATQTVTEDGSKTITFHATDVDTTDTLTPSVSATHGTTALNTQGEVVFTPDANYNGPATVVISVTDGHTTTSQTINVDVTPANDAPVITPIPPISATEDGSIVTGKIASTDIDTGDTASFKTTFTQGGFTLNTDGSYKLDPTDASFQHLKAGEIETLTIPVTVTDSTGATDTKNLVITITGTNDAPTISGIDTGTLKEDISANPQSHNLTATGKLDITDVDTGESSFVAHGFNKTALQGHYGHLQVSPDGSWSYFADNSQTAIQTLGKGEHLTDTIQVTSKDGTTHDIVITINGTNDVPVIKPVATQTVTEDGSKTITFHATDVDTTDTLTPSVSATHGTAALNTQGEIVFTPDANYNGPATVVLSVTDGHTTTSQTINVDVTPANDAPVITPIPPISATEDGSVITGKIASTDIDTGDTASFKTTFTQGGFTLNTDGSYKLDPTDASFQHLKAGEIETLTIPVTVTDSAGATDTKDLVITITGTNDAPTISGIDTGTLKEDVSANPQSHNLTATGKLDIVDIDTGESSFVGHGFNKTGLQGHYGHLQISPDGSWSYFADNSQSAIQTLGNNEHLTDTIQVTSKDGTTHDIVITINGTNDAAVISGVDTGDVTEGNAGQDMSPDYAQPGMAFLGRSTIDATGKLDITDADAGEAEFDTHGIGFTYSGQYGDLLLNKDGSWSYHADTGQIRSTGGLTSTRGTTIDQLGENQTLTDTVTVFTKDGTSHDIVITIHGSNDRPYCSSEVQLNSGKEDLVQTITSTELLANTVDVDANDAGKLSIANLHADHGSILDNKDGTFTFTPNSDYNGKVQFTYDVKDAHGGITHTGASTTLANRQDSATFGGTDTGDVHEGHTYTAPDGSMTGGSVDDRSPDHMHGNIGKLWNDEIHTEGHLAIIDADTGESYALNGVYQGSLGRVILQSNGDWSYFASIGQDATGRAIDHLGKGESLTDTVTVKSADGTTHDIVVTIHGDNDSPYCSSEVQLNSGKEDLAQTITSAELLANTIDVDTNDLGKLTIANLHVDHGSIQDNQDGTFTFTPTKDYNGQVHFTYDVADAHGGITATGANLHLQATGDAATITGIDQGNVTEDRGYIDTQYNLHFDGKLDIVDPDQGEAQFDIQRGHTYHGIGYDTKMGGWVLLQQDGTYTYTIDNRKPEIQNLGSTETLVDKVTIHSVDGTSHEIQITIHGTNDDPKVSSVTTLPAGTEDTDVVLHVSDLLANATDIDHNDAGQLSVANLTADHGKITDNHDGTFTFHPALDYNGKVSFSYDVKDAHAGSTATSASMTLAPTSDAAVITGSGSGVKEDINVDISSGHLLGASGVFHVVDPDGPAQSQFPDVLYGGIYQGSHGGDLQVNSNGNYYYHISNYLVQHLSEGEILKEEYTIHSVDGTQHKVEFTVEGTNDKPVLSAQSQSVTEGGTLLSGQMHATDVDTKDTHTFTIDKPVDGLTFNNDGSYTFDPSHASYQNLGANNDQVIHVQVKVDDHNGGTDTKTLTLVVHGTNDGATIGGQDTFTVQEDHNLTLNSGNTIIYNGQLTITDADAGEDHFDGNLHQNQQTGTWDTGYTTQEGGKLILQSNGSYRYEIDNSLAKIQSLGSSETLIDTVTVRSADGTPHQIQVTIEGDNDAPVVSSAVTLTAGTEDTDVVLHISDLLANATDIDHNDAGQLSVTNLTADHGKITDNHDGTFTFHPNQDYNGKVSFTYDVLDKHGGSVATTASITLAPTRDSAVISGNDTGTIIEDHNVGHSSAQKIAISGSLSVTDPDTGEDHFRFDQFGEKAIHDPFGGDLRITPAGSWGYEVSNSRLQSLAEGEVEKVVYRVYSADHTAHDITITVTGTNDQPTITATTLAHGTEDTHYQMQASQFGFTDIDTGDTLHFIAITDLPPATQGKFLLDGHDVTTGQQIPTADISKLQFVPTQDFNGDVQFKYTVNDGHADSLETTNTLRIDPVADAATFTGDSGSIGEDTNIHHNVHASGAATIPDALVCHGHLVISDVDGQGEETLDLKGQQHISQDGTYGHFIISASGSWVYSADNSDTRIQNLDNRQTLTDHIEVTSKDGTKHSITVTINGTTDDPVLHSLSDSGVQHSGPIEGNLLTGSGTVQGVSGAATDTDSNAHLVLQDIQINDPVSGYVAVRPGQPHTMVGIGTLAIEANGHYIFTPEAGFTGKVPSMVYRVGDDGGNPIGDSSQNSLSIEVTPPQPNTVSLTLATGSDSGSKGDLITNDNTPSVEGHTLIPNSSVDIVENGKVIGTTVSDGNGDYHLDLPGLTDATHTLQAVATEPLSSAQVQSHPMAVVIDTTATVAIEPISTDSMLTGTERSHSFDITGSVTGVDDGQTVQIELEHQTYQGQVSGGKWHVTLPASLASSLQGGVHQVTVSVTDNAGNLATMASPLFVVDGTNTPPLPIMHTPHITGGGGVGSHVTGDLIAPPLLQQLHPQVGSGWGILAPDGHTVTHLQGQYGTLVIDPQTGHVDYQYSSAPTPGQKAAGGTHWAGQTTSDQHHDVFQVMYHDTHSSNVDVKVNLDVTYMHGHSGHNQASTQLVGMSVTPVVPSVQHDEPDSPLTFEASVTIVDDSNGPNEQHVSTTESQHHDTSHHGAAAYLDALGIKPDATSTTVDDQPADMDIVLAQVDQPDPATHDQAHLDMSDALEHHDANVNHNQDDEHHHHNDVDGLPDIDPNP